MTQPVRLAIIGAGSRGTNYAQLAVQTGEASVVAVAEPDRSRRELFAAMYGLDPARVFASWEELVEQPRLADAVVIATPDRLHERPVVACAGNGYAILLEKPMAPTREEAARIVEAVEHNDIVLGIGHVMRYSTYTRMLRRILDDGAIGSIVSVEHLEPIGWWHFAHSYVRGNWAVERESSSMLMAKSSHDLDWLSYIVGKPVAKVSSFGGLFHFRPENKPAEATDRCWDCPLQNTCAYSATVIYPRFLGDPVFERWPLQVLTPSVTPESVADAIENGPYGECVYNGRNDVADHQVVNLEFADGATASFTVTAFAELDFRKTRIFGTKGRIEGDGISIDVHDFETDSHAVFETGLESGASAADGHGGADGELVKTFLRAVLRNDQSELGFSPRQSLVSHNLVWAAEEARHSGTVVSMNP